MSYGKKWGKYDDILGKVDKVTLLDQHETLNLVAKKREGRFRDDETLYKRLQA